MVTLSCGSKVFLFGEYVALEGGPTLLASLEPRFELTAFKKPQSSVGPIGFAAKGPVVDFLAKEQGFFNNWTLEFKDPHQGRGGFGASTAQILLLMGLRDLSEASRSISESSFDFHLMHKEYRALHSADKVLPSGADFMVQARGGLLAFDREHGRLDNYIWPYDNIEILVYSTGQKLKTHEHLADLKVVDLQILKKIAALGVDAIKEMDPVKFADCINQYHEELSRQGLVAEHTLAILESIKKQEGVLAVKGCGAMGFDSFLVLKKKSAVVHGLDAYALMGKIPNMLTQGISFQGDFR